MQYWNLESRELFLADCMVVQHGNVHTSLPSYGYLIKGMCEGNINCNKRVGRIKYKIITSKCMGICIHSYCVTLLDNALTTYRFKREKWSLSCGVKPISGFTQVLKRLGLYPLVYESTHRKAFGRINLESMSATANAEVPISHHTETFLLCPRKDRWQASRVLFEPAVAIGRIRTTNGERKLHKTERV